MIAPNRPPVARPDSATTTAGTAITIDALANDNDPEGSALTLAAVTMPAHGNLSLSADQEVLYTPAAGFVGTDSFDYTIRDSAGATADGAGHGGGDAPQRASDSRARQRGHERSANQPQPARRTTMTRTVIRCA